MGYLSRVLANNGSERRVAFDRGIANFCPKLLNSFWVPKYAANDYLKRSPVWPGDILEPHPSVFVQPARTACNVHVDNTFTNFMMVQFAGRKRWTVFPFDRETQNVALRRAKLAVEEHDGQLHWDRSHDITTDTKVAKKEA